MRSIATGLLALVMLFTSSVFGEVAYFCPMNGQVRSECCCDHVPAGAGEDCAGVAEAEDCCELRFTTADREPARIEASRHQARPNPLAAALPWVPLLPPATKDAHAALGARGPPSGSGPRLFVWKSSYLI